MYSPHNQAWLPWQVDKHCGQNRFLPAIRKQCCVAGHLALPLPDGQKLWVSQRVLFLISSITDKFLWLIWTVWNRYKKPDERQPLVAAMHIFMPMLKDRFIQLLPEHSGDSVLIQKQIFKILYALFQVKLYTLHVLFRIYFILVL